VTSLIEQVRLAQLARDWSVQQLLDKSGLSMERSVLHRKLKGTTPATTAECEALARALDITLVYPQPAKAKPKKSAKRAAA
jgi:transcriptional regulator with XRE-family HTH domain